MDQRRTFWTPVHQSLDLGAFPTLLNYLEVYLIICDGNVSYIFDMQGEEAMEGWQLKVSDIYLN